MSLPLASQRTFLYKRFPQIVLTPIGDLLFSASEQGAWYDPSDLSTLFQDAAGSTPVTAVEQPVGRMLDKSGRGNHATQATTTKRPVYSRRVNLLTKTEQFDSVAWGKSGATITGNTGIAPDGASTADSVTFSSSADYVIQQYPGYTSTVGAQIVISLHVKSASRLLVFGGATPAGTDIYTSTPLAGGWYLQKVVRTFTAATTGTIQYLFAGTYATGTFEVWGASLTLATDAHLPYQWVNTDTDYDADPNKFPAYRRLDGVDDSHASATGGGGTSGFFFSAAVSPQGGAGTARTLFSDAGTNTGYIVRLNTSNQLELAAGNGTAYTTIATSGALAVGTTNVIQAWDDGTNLNVKIGNGATASIARPVVSAGTAGYTMGQNNGASTGYFNGRAYSTIYRKDSGLTQVQRESVALYQLQKARMP